MLLQFFNRFYLLGLTYEKYVLPIFQEIYVMRKTLDKQADPKLESIRNQLLDLIHMD